MSQAEEYRNCELVFYPGFDPKGPSPLPFQNNQQLSIEQSLRFILSKNKENLTARGVGRALHSFLATSRMRHFLRDAFWWLFIEFFAPVDFAVILENAKKNNLVGDEEFSMYGVDNVNPIVEAQLRAAYEERKQPDPFPMSKSTTSTPITTKGQFFASSDRVLPVHLLSHDCRNRTVEELTVIASPRASVHVLNELILEGQSAGLGEGRQPADSKLDSISRHSESPASRASSTSEQSWPSSAEESISSSMKINRYCPMRSVQLHTIPTDARTQIVAKEQFKLFARMANNYGLHLQVHIPRLSPTIKDCISRYLPEVISETLFVSLFQSLPFACRMMKREFQLRIGRIVSFWIGGVERALDVSKWVAHAEELSKGYNVAVTRFLKKKSAKQIILATTPSGKREAQQRTSNARKSGIPQTANSTTRNNLSRPSTLRPSLLTQERPDVVGRSFDFIPIVSTSTSSTTKALHPTPPLQQPPQQATTTASKISAEQRKMASIRTEVDAMKNELRRVIETHTFSLFHYAAKSSEPSPNKKGTPSWGAGSKSPQSPRSNNSVQPQRLALAFALTAPKRNVHVIKQEIDERYRPVPPWYANPHERSPRERKAPDLKFALSNWSPLLQRFFAQNGERNPQHPETIRWTI